MVGVDKVGVVGEPACEEGGDHKGDRVKQEHPQGGTSLPVRGHEEPGGSPPAEEPRPAEVETNRTENAPCQQQLSERVEEK